MTWIRLDVDRRQHQVVVRLAQSLRIRRAEAAGLYDNVLLGFGEHQKDGDATKVPDMSLEIWADWEGGKGRFAKVFRAECVEDKGPEKGLVKGWMKRQWKLLQKQLADARKRKPPKGLRLVGGGDDGSDPQETLGGTREKPSGVPAKNPRGNPEKKESHGTSKRYIPERDISQLVAATAETLRVRPHGAPALERAGTAAPIPGSEILQ